MQTLLQPYLPGEPLTSGQLEKINLYLALLLRWNARTNLTAVREPEAILQRQVGESLFAANYLPRAGSLLDFGSGAGLPGIPIAILIPSLSVTLAESQGKKASFLREAARTLELTLTVWGRRVEAMSAEQTYDCVTFRAVDDSEAMLPLALERVSVGGTLVRYVGGCSAERIKGWIEESFPIPESEGRLTRLRRG